MDEQKWRKITQVYEAGNFGIPATAIELTSCGDLRSVELQPNKNKVRNQKDENYEEKNVEKPHQACNPNKCELLNIDSLSKSKLKNHGEQSDVDENLQQPVKTSRHVTEIIRSKTLKNKSEEEATVDQETSISPRVLQNISGNDKNGRTNVHNSQNYSLVQEKHLDFILNRLNLLEKRINDLVKSLPEKVQLICEKYLEKCKIEHSGSGQSITFCDHPTKTQSWNHSPVIKPKSNLLTDFRRKVRDSNTESQSRNISNNHDKFVAANSCYSEYHSSEGTLCCTESIKIAEFESKLAALEKAVNILKMRFVKYLRNNSSIRIARRQ